MKREQKLRNLILDKYPSLRQFAIEADIPYSTLMTLLYRDIGGFKPSPYSLYESACTLNDTWGFSYYDKNRKSPEQLAKNKSHLNFLGINYLLNIGPDPLGRIPVEAKELLININKY